MVKKLFTAIILIFSGITSGAQSLVSISPDHGSINQTLTTTITGSNFYFLQGSQPTINDTYLNNGCCTFIYPNWINVLDDDHFEANWTLTYPPGIYDLRHDYLPFGGWSVVLSNAFTITDSCLISLTPSSGAVCLGDSVKLSYSAAGSYQWKLNGANISGATSSIYYAKTPGLYTVLTTGSICPGTSSPVTVTINALPTVTITPSATQHICTGQSVTLQASTGTGFTYQWKKNGSFILAAAASLIVQDSGNYKVVITNSNGCSDISPSVLVKVNGLPSAIVTKQPGSANGKDASLSNYNPLTNYGTNVELDATAWTIGGIVANERSLFQFDLSSIPPGSSIYSAALTLYFDSTALGGFHTQYGSNSALIQKVIAPWDENTVTWNNQPATTAINQVVLPVSTSTMQDYNNIDVKNIVQTMVDSPSTNNGFLLKLVTELYYRSLLFCSSDHPNASRHPKLVIKYVGAPISTSNGSVICSGDSTVLQTNTGSYFYQWKKNGNAISGATASKYTAKTSGTYTVKITNNAGCSILSPGKVITVNPVPNASISPQGPTTFCNGDSVELKTTFGTGYSYQWKKNNTNLSGATARKYIAKTAGNYKVKVTSNGCTKLSNPVTINVPCRDENNLSAGNDFNVEAYPNPSSGDFNFKFNNASGEKTIIRIYDHTGRMTMEEQYKDATEILSISLSGPGIYKAVVIRGRNIKVLSLVKTE